MFITLEGPNGVGKTTVTNVVIEKLSQLGLDVFLTKEPTKSPLGIFLKGGEGVYHGETLACLAAADRYFHIENEIVPALQSGKIVISDRYIESSLVLQRLDGCSLNFIWGLHSKIIIPDISIILFAKSETIRRRIMLRNVALSRFEKEKLCDTEVSYYWDAAEFLISKGFKVVVVNNEDSSAVQVGEFISVIIQQLMSQKGRSK